MLNISWIVFPGIAVMEVCLSNLLQKKLLECVHLTDSPSASCLGPSLPSPRGHAFPSLLLSVSETVGFTTVDMSETALPWATLWENPCWSGCDFLKKYSTVEAIAN